MTVVPQQTKYYEENISITWKRNVSSHFRENCLLERGVFYQFDGSASAFDIYEQVINLDVFIKLLVEESNLYSQQNVRKFLTNTREIKAFIGVNYIMTVNQLLIMPIYCYCDHFVGNVDIENIFTRPRYQEVTKPSLYRPHKTRQTGKGFKIRPIIDHLNESFQAVFSNEPEQIIDKHMTKFKGSSSMRQYLKMKPQKCGFKWCF